MEYSCNEVKNINEFKLSNNNSNMFYFDYDELKFNNKISRRIEKELKNSIKLNNLIKIQCVCLKKDNKIEEGILELVRLMCVLNKNNVKIICAVIRENEKDYELNILLTNDKRFNYSEIMDALNAN